MITVLLRSSGMINTALRLCVCEYKKLAGQRTEGRFHKRIADIY